jgi:hypothetical protein
VSQGCDSERLIDEIQNLKKTFRQNGYSAGEVHQALNPKQITHSQGRKLAALATIHFTQGTSGKICRLVKVKK